jgi:gas vesicle protein
MTENHSNIGSNNIVWFLAGLGLGTVTAILYAPKSGRETREAIVAGVDAGRKNLVSLGRKVGRQISSVVGPGNKTVTTKRQVKAVGNIGREAVSGDVAER